VTDQERVEIAKWALERQLGWIAAADAKAGYIVAMDTAMLAALGALLTTVKMLAPWSIGFVVSGGTLLSIAIGCAGAVFFPRTFGPLRSLIFFGPIAKMDAVEYEEALRKYTSSDWLNDLSLQIQRNAEVAAEKHRWVRIAIMWSVLGAPLWFVAVILLCWRN